MCLRTFYEYARNVDPEKYDEIWKKKIISQKITNRAKRRIREEIKKCKDGKPYSRCIKDLWEKEFKSDFNYNFLRLIARSEDRKMYDKIWNLGIPENAKKRLKKRVLEEIKKYDKDKSHVKYIEELWESEFKNEISEAGWVRRFARKVNPKKYDLIWGREIHPRVKSRLKRLINSEIRKFKKGESYKKLSVIWKGNFKDYEISQNSFSRIVKDLFQKDYKLMWSYERILSPKREKIVKDILDIQTHLNLGQIAIRHEISLCSVRRISVNEVQQNYPEHKHTERFRWGCTIN